MSFSCTRMSLLMKRSGIQDSPDLLYRNFKVILVERITPQISQIPPILFDYAAS